MDVELIEGEYKVAWVNLDEGYNGDYDPEDEEDENLLRLDVELLTKDGWESKCSYCTCIPANAEESVLQEKLRKIMDAIKSVPKSRIKKVCEKLTSEL